MGAVGGRGRYVLVFCLSGVEWGCCDFVFWGGCMWCFGVKGL